MSKRIGNIAIIEYQGDEKCQLCGKTEECRPYGPNGENICFDCGMKNKEQTERMMNKMLFGVGLGDKNVN